MNRYTKEYFFCPVPKCLDSMLLKTRSRLYEFGVWKQAIAKHFETEMVMCWEEPSYRQNSQHIRAFILKNVTNFQLQPKNRGYYVKKNVEVRHCGVKSWKKCPVYQTNHLVPLNCRAVRAYWMLCRQTRLQSIQQTRRQPTTGYRLAQAEQNHKRMRQKSARKMWLDVLWRSVLGRVLEQPRWRPWIQKTREFKRMLSRSW